MNRTRLWLLVGAVSLWTASALAAADRPGTDSPLKRIYEAASAGSISSDEATLLRVRAIAHPELLPKEFRAATPTFERCGTEVLLSAWRDRSRLSAGSQAQLAADLSRPSTTNFFDSPGGYFRIHYNIAGGHAVPLADLNSNLVPDYVERLADYSDSSWRQEVIQYGYLPPPSDGSAGGSSAYDIYCQVIGAYGYTQPETAGPAPWNDYTSYVVVHSTFLGFPPNTDPDGDQLGAAKVTLAHEFLHTCQFAYDVNENSSWMEMTATWMEDEVFDPVNDNYNYLPNFFSQPHAPLWGVSPYGAFVWPRYLSEAYGDDVIRQIWVQCITGSAINVIDSVLSGLGSSRDLAFSAFTDWNWITNSRSDAMHYEEAASYPLMPVMRTHSTYPVTTQTSAQPPNGMASNYIQFVTSALPAGHPLRVNFNGEDGWSWGAHIVAKNSLGLCIEIPLSLDGNGQGEATLTNASTYTQVALVPALLAINGGADYAYTACVGPTAPDLLLPLNTANASLPVALSWDAVGGALTYHYQVDQDSLFGSPDFDSVITGASATVAGLTEESTYYWRVSVTDACGESGYGEAQSFKPVCGVSLTGDVDISSSVTSADVIVMVNFIFKSGLPPQPQPEAGDVDCSGSLTSADIVKLVNFVFKSGAPPCDVCSIL